VTILRIPKQVMACIIAATVTAAVTALLVMTAAMLVAGFDPAALTAPQPTVTVTQLVPPPPPPPPVPSWPGYRCRREAQTVTCQQPGFHSLAPHGGR
jgi:hypothetical protein